MTVANQERNKTKGERHIYVPVEHGGVLYEELHLAVMAQIIGSCVLAFEVRFYLTIERHYGRRSPRCRVTPQHDAEHGRKTSKAPSCTAYKTYQLFGAEA